MAGHRRAVTEVSFASDAVAVTDKPSNTERLATAGTDGIVVVWELSENGPRQLAEFQDHVGAVNDLAWNSSGTKLVSAGDDRTVRLRHWNVADSRNADNSVSTLLAHEDAVWTLAVGVDRLTSGALDGAVQLWNLAREEPGITPVVLRNHRRTIQNVSASRDGQSLLALSSDRDHTWSLWNRDVETEFSLVDTSRFHDVISRASASAWSPQSQTAAIAGSDSLIMLLTVAGREVTSRKVEVPDASINAMIFSADGLKLFFVGNSGVFGNIDLASRESNAAAGQLTTSRMGDSDLVSIAAASQGEQLAIGTEDGGVVLWSSEDQWKLLPGSHRDAITDLAFSPDGNLLASVSGDRSAHVWKRSPDGTFMASPLVLVMHKERIRAAAFTPDSRTLLTVSDDETAILWPLNSDSPEKEATILIGHESAIHACAISDDGRWAITGSDDGTVRLWDLDSDNPSASVVIMYNFGEPVRAIDLIDQSRTLVAGTRNGELFVWPLDPDELLNRVRLSAGRSLSPQEMQQFKTAAGGVDDDTRQIDGSRSQ